MDWNEVEQIRDSYVAAGISDRVVTFLNDILRTRKDLRPGQARWLNDILENGDPGPNVALGKELEDLAPDAGPDGRHLVNIIRRLRSGLKPKDWELDVAARVRARVLDPSAPMTPHQHAVMKSLEAYVIGSVNWWYWRRQEGKLRKAQSIVTSCLQTGNIISQDWVWIQDNFKSVIRGIETSAGEEGQIRFWRGPGGWKTVMVMGNGYYKQGTGMVQDCMFDGKLMPIKIDQLRKRMPKEAK